MSDGEPAPVIPLPAPVDRTTRLGPFPSGRCALRFVGYAALGSVLALLVAPVVALPFLGGGFLLTTYQRDGKSLDEHASAFVAWRLRARAPSVRSGIQGPVASDAAFLRIPGGRTLSCLAVTGVPVAFLPPEDARGMFQAYRDFVRGLDDAIFFRVATEPLSDRLLRLPPTSDGRGDEGPARDGYDEMVRLLCRRRQRRLVEIVLAEPGVDAAARTKLERKTRAVAEGLRTLGLEPRRRVGPGLALALSRLGWSGEVVG